MNQPQTRQTRNAEPAHGAAAQPLMLTRFTVPGMRCAGCIAKLESGLPRQPGIAAARVHFGDRRVTLEHDPALSLPQLMAAFDAVGFTAQRQADDADAPAASDLPLLLKALAVASFAAMNVMLLSVGIWSGADGATRHLFHWLSAAIALPAIAYAARPFFLSAWDAVRRGRTNMDVPISIGIILTSAMSLFETVIGGPHAWFDGAIMLTAFLLGGRVLDRMAQDRARSGVAALRRQAPAGAMVLNDAGVTQWQDAAAIVPGMRLAVAVGERLVADAVIASGDTLIDRALMTGESVPVPVGPAAVVEAGVLNLGAPITVMVTHAPADSSLADIARMMADMTSGKSKYRRIADRVSRLYAPFVHTLAALSFAGWMLAGLGWHGSLLIAVAVLLITCPCALGLAVPVAQVISASALMKRGILVKDGAAFERLAETDHVLLDKTGTLTLGRPDVAGLDALNAAQRATLLALAQASLHPLSRAIADALVARGTAAAATLSDVRETAGQGVRALLADGTPVTLGRASAARTEDADAEADAATSGTMALLTIGDAPPLRLDFADRPRPDMVGAVRRLQAMGLGAGIVSGEHAAAVAPLAQQTGLPAIADARPADKIAAITDLQDAGRRVLMVGDGLNDGPALAAAHAAIAPGSASDASRQAADVVFLGDSLQAVPLAVATARRTMAIVRQNIALSILYNLLAVPLAVLGYVTPLVAALAMSGSSLIVIGNAMRLWRVRT